MNDLELQTKLKNVPLPSRPDEYWEDFPSRIRMQLRQPSYEMAPHRPWRNPVVWTTGFALAVALFFVCLQFHPLQTAAAAAARQERQFHEQLARLDAGLHRLMLNTDGMGYLVADSN
jgi:hypothetical protein